jgi:hypothetical protein
MVSIHGRLNENWTLIRTVTEPRLRSGKMDLTGPFRKYFRRQPKARPPSDFLVRLVSEVKAFQDQGNIPEMLRVSLALRMPGVADHRRKTSSLGEPS